MVFEIAFETAVQTSYHSGIYDLEDESADIILFIMHLVVCIVFHLRQCFRVVLPQQPFHSRASRHHPY